MEASGQAPEERLQQDRLGTDFALAFPQCQLFYFRPVAPRQGILSEPWETQRGGCWVCLASSALLQPWVLQPRARPWARPRVRHPGLALSLTHMKGTLSRVTCPTEKVPIL